MLENLAAFAQRLKRLRMTQGLLFSASNRCGSVWHMLLTVALMALALAIRLVIAPVSAGLQSVTF